MKIKENSLNRLYFVSAQIKKEQNEEEEEKQQPIPNKLNAKIVTGTILLHAFALS